MPRTPRRNQPSSSDRFIVAEESESESESISESEPGLEEEEEDGAVSDAVEETDSGDKQEAPRDEVKRAAPITISLKKVCKVCKGTGHQAGFQGATYIDCPKKPCFLCKKPGHTTISCPHRVAMEHGVIPVLRRGNQTLMDYVFERQLLPKVQKMKPSFVIPNQLDCGYLELHSRRVTTLEFHPSKNNVLLSGDKKGKLVVWDYVKLHEKTVYGSIHSCIVNNIKFDLNNDGTFYTSSSDGTVCFTDLETGMPQSLMNVNPDGWNGPSTWRMLYGMDMNSDKGLLLIADNFGYLYMLDGRSKTRVGEPILVHKKGSKVVGLHCNPFEPNLLISCGNDHFARIWDIRRLEGRAPLSSLSHGRVVNSAYFSLQTGTKILTTSLDNRIRVWDSIFGKLDSPSREIVHSHDFNRYLTPFRAEWDPKDPSESLAVIGRYISENYNGVALHPIDFIDTSTGKLVAEVFDPDIKTISPVNKLHPRDDVMASGSSRALFIWRPKVHGESIQKPKKSMFGKDDKKSKRKFDGDSDDDNDSFPKGKNANGKKRDGKSTKSSLKKVKC